MEPLGSDKCQEAARMGNLIKKALEGLQLRVAFITCLVRLSLYRHIYHSLPLGLFKGLSSVQELANHGWCRAKGLPLSASGILRQLAVWGLAKLEVCKVRVRSAGRSQAGSCAGWYKNPEGRFFILRP